MKKILIVMLLAGFASNAQTEQPVKKEHKHKNITHVDPVCKMKVSENGKIKATVAGKDYNFCSESCKASFVKNPEKFLKK